MPSKALVTLLGHVGKEPEIKYSQSGMAIVSFSVATSKGKKQDDGWVNKTTWWNCTAFGKTGESVGNYVHSGNLVLVSGEAELDEWEAKDGTTRQTLKVIVASCECLERREKSSGNAREKLDATSPALAPVVDDSDIPF